MALHSLKERYAGKVKGIFVDPPYFFNNSKKGDGFKYNSRFKLSTWLTFCKNRFSVAKDFLSDDGIIAISIGTDGYSQLKLILDDVFKVSEDYKRYIGTITWRKTDNQSNIGDFANVIDYILLYRKNGNTKLNKLPLTEKAKKEYSYEDKKGKYRRSNLLDLTRGRYEYSVITPDGDILNGPWMIDKKEFDRIKESDEIHWPSKGKQIPYGKIYLKDSIEKGQIASDFWDSSFGTNQRSADEIKKLFGNRVFDFAKPEMLLMNVISLISKENDIIFDFFMGTATTQAVAMKMNRKFIGIEQMDYINTVSVPRLQKVIEGEQGGISKDVDWQGGGSFVYAELMELNQLYMKKIDQTSSKEELAELWNELDNNADLNFQLDKEKLTNELLKEHDEEEGSITFNDLTFEEQKEIFKKALDKNQLYVSYSEIEDANVIISDNDKAFNHSFYNGEED
ncbi:site-specific DNA-methyltransferase [Enterococcus hirae]|nr:site-specific DNA-methyltransferase [Enterococcus hirae]QQU14801.1 site-specific DNA-methyltransferase [Enterococcus hirae]